MDFWARLIGGVGKTPSKKQVTACNPQQRLARFKRIYNQILQTWRGTPSLTSESAAAAVDSIRLFLQHLTSLLHEESRSPSPHLCVSFASSSQIYSTISKIASLSRNEGLAHEAISAFSTLIDSEDEEFLGENAFAKAIMSFAGKVAGTRAMIIGPETEGDVVELLFGIAAKIRLQPEILPAWFTSSSHEHDVDNEAAPRMKFIGAANKDDFPLFYLLIDYVHHEGRIGDFARTGLLYIIESAASSADLERWIVESDLATLMASGLGALYSQLSRKLVVSYAADETPAILALSDYSLPPAQSGAEISASRDFQGHMDTFLSYLLFWQDVLEHCKSSEVTQTLLDHFRILFLEQLLYPSLLESSDVDGGSSVAVFTYLRRILDSLEHPSLIHLILHYLLALPDQPVPQETPLSRPLGISRRKTLDLLTNFPDMTNKPSPSLFNLTDLILSSMQSQSQQTVTATLKLVSVILRRHYQYAFSTLLQTIKIDSSEPQRTIGAHNKEMALLFSLVQTIGSHADINSSYENYLKDNLVLLESHPCLGQLRSLSQEDTKVHLRGCRPSIINGGPREVYLHTLKCQDPFLETLVQVMQNFFVNPVEMNLSLTETVVNLAACGHMRLEGWLLVNPANYQFRDDGGHDPEQVLENDMTPRMSDTVNTAEVHEQAQMAAIKQARREPCWASEHIPPIIAVLQILGDQITTFRAEIPDLETYLSERKRIFRVSDELNEALASVPSDNPSVRKEKASPLPTRGTSKPVKGPTSSSLSQRVFLDKNSKNLSRSSSPLRGRQQRAPEDKRSLTPSGAGRLTQHETKDSPTPSQRSRIASSSSSSRRDRSVVVQYTNTQSAESTVLMRKIFVQTWHIPGSAAESNNNSRSSDGPSTDNITVGTDGSEMMTNGNEISISHLLTNIIILQEFILELAALIQVRASLFGEIKFL